MKYFWIVFLIANQARTSDPTYMPEHIKNGLVTLIFTGLCTKVAAQANNESDPYNFSNQATIGWAWWQIAAGGFAVISVVSNFLAPWYYWRKIDNDIGNSLEEQIKILKQENDLIKSNLEWCSDLARSNSYR